LSITSIIALRGRILGEQEAREPADEDVGDRVETLPRGHVIAPSSSSTVVSQLLAARSPLSD